MVCEPGLPLSLPVMLMLQGGDWGAIITRALVK